MEKEKKIMKSLIKKYISDELYIELYKVTKMATFTNNERGVVIENLLKRFGIEYGRLGSGTNRIGILIGGYVFKFSLDKDGMIDNRREFLYAKDLQPYCIKVYECIPNGLISVSEYVNVLDYEVFTKPEIQERMREILSDISGRLLIGDVGITSKNHANWGIRNTDGELVMLDFAYVYNMSYKTFLCHCDGKTLLRYDKDYINLYCPRCGRKYTFGQIRKRITKKIQEEEIGDISRLSYNLSKPEQEVEVIKEFEPDDVQKEIEQEEETRPLTNKEKLKEMKDFLKSRRITDEDEDY